MKDSKRIQDESEVIGKHLKVGDMFIKDGKIVEVKKEDPLSCLDCVYRNSEDECSSSVPVCEGVYFKYLNEE